MRLAALFVLLVVLAGCGQSGVYTQQDLREVKHGYQVLVPIYRGFLKAYITHNGAALDRYYRREKQACRLVNAIDSRDTIDPNINLFQASAGLDGFCNDMDSHYARWRVSRGEPYDKTVDPADPSDIVTNRGPTIHRLILYLKRPGALS